MFERANKVSEIISSENPRIAPMPSRLARVPDNNLANVITRAQSFVDSVVQAPEQRRLLHHALRVLGAQFREEELLPFVKLPLLVHAALRGEQNPAHPLTVATTFVFLGADLLDDLADGDLDDAWQEYRPEEIGLAATTLLSALPQLVLSGLAVSSCTRVAMQETLARGLLCMSEGQQGDLALNGENNPGAEDVVTSVAGKSGAELGMFCALAAQLAEAPESVVQRYAEFGRALGTAGQLASDCHDIFQAGTSRDLANGTRTLPVAMYMQRLRGEGHEEFLTLLEEAGKDRRARETIRRKLHSDGIVMRCAFAVEIYCLRAMRALEEVYPRGPAAQALRKMVEHVSFFSKKGGERWGKNQYKG